jgi:crotonobetainyl-CoA:carnitine CoA-transferase CaiB-like acyl-CoA transferase
MYSLLHGVRVLELSLLAPDLLGMHLADLGAEVIKIEQPPAGDYLRDIGARKVAGINLMHLRWNRGKRSLLLDLKQSRGQAVLHRLAARSDIFIDGLRGGAAGRCGADYERIRACNRAVVYCSLSGTGQSGPYAKLATHGVAYDAYAGLAPPAIHADGSPRIPNYTPVGIYAAPLYAAMAVCAALVAARRSGEGRRIDVAELVAAVSWQAERIDALLNRASVEIPDMTDSVRYQYYRTADDRVVLFQASERKFWLRFCEAVGRPDLFAAKPGAPAGDHARGDETLRAELASIFRSRTRSEWIGFFIDHDIPGGPVHEPNEVPLDPHFRAHAPLFEQDHPAAGRLRLFATPVAVERESFSALPAPSPGQHSGEVLRSVLEMSATELAELRAANVVQGN